MIGSRDENQQFHSHPELSYAPSKPTGAKIMARYTLHGMWPSGPTYKVGLMLALCAEPFDYVHVNLRGGEQKSPEYLAGNRYGVVPTLTDNHTEENYCQSSAILQYLAETTGRLNGASASQRTVAREWVFWCADRLGPGVYRTRAAKVGFAKFPDDVVAHYQTAAHAGLNELDAWLKHNDWVAGGASATFGDVDIYGVVAYCGQAGIDLADHAGVRAWMARLEALPGFQSIDILLPKESRKA
jgi:glutathione S-transferase